MEAMTSNKRRRRRKIIALRLSGLSISNALLFSSYVHICHGWSSSELQPVVRELVTYTYQLCVIPGIYTDVIIGQQGFLADALWSTTGSAIAIASTTTTSTMHHQLMAKTTVKIDKIICQNGALMGESAVPGAYSSACMGLSERIAPLPRYRERMSTITSKRVATANNKMGCRNNGLDNQQDQNGVQLSGTIVVQKRAGGSGNTDMTVWKLGLLLTRLLDYVTAHGHPMTFRVALGLNIAVNTILGMPVIK